MRILHRRTKKRVRKNPPDCIFGDGYKAVGLFVMDWACACIHQPGKRHAKKGQQALCAQHVNRASPNRNMQLVRVFDRELLIKLGWLDEKLSYFKRKKIARSRK